MAFYSILAFIHIWLTIEVWQISLNFNVSISGASKKGVGAVLQQTEQKENYWKPVAYASCFLTDFEGKYSINELELLAVIWSVEHFKNYVYGTNFKIISDHKALQSVLPIMYLAATHHQMKAQVEKFEKGFEIIIGKRQQPMKFEQTPNCNKIENRQVLTVESNTV